MSVTLDLRNQLKIVESWCNACYNDPSGFTKGAEALLAKQRHKLLKQLLRAQLKEFQ